jgi:hypothetical protein
MVVQWKKRKRKCVKSLVCSVKISLDISFKMHENLLLKIFSVQHRRVFQGILKDMHSSSFYCNLTNLLHTSFS